MSTGSTHSRRAARAERAAVRNLPVILQTEVAECALACLCMVAQAAGMDLDLAQLRRRYGSSLRGMSMARLVEVAESLGFNARVLRGEPNELRGARTPCILHWNLNHFVVLKKVARRGLEIHDPARGFRTVPYTEADASFTGLLIELVPKQSYTPPKRKPRLSVSTLFGSISGLRRAILQITGIALCIELVGLVLPYQIQWLVDSIVPAEDKTLLVASAVAFGLLLALQNVLSLGNAWIITWLGARLNRDWVNNLFAHLLRLPLDFFEKRHMGDIVSRFGSVKAVQSTLTGGFIEAVLSGIVGSAVLGVLWVYSASAAGVAALFLASYVAAKAVTFRWLWNLNEQQIVYNARQQSELMESVRGVQAIKLAGKESIRASRFFHVTSQALDRDMRSQRMSMAFTSATQALIGFQRIALMTVAAYFAIEGGMSTGMLVALVAYSDQFMNKSMTLVDRIFSFKMLKLQFERIGDIALEIPEPTVDSGASSLQDSPEFIRVENLGFRYSEGDPWIFQNLSFTISKGESLAIVGPSGCGKTTLAKVLLGLLRPTVGTVSFGGKSVHGGGCHAYRSMVGAVMQDDQLFAGSISENISFFDEAADDGNVKRAASLAGIHEEVAEMVMGYETLVGDMGSSLSGGQKQRVLLARALYRKPQVLILDEATSHLDVAREKEINQNIAAADCTKVVIAHRQATIDLCDTVIDLRRTKEGIHLAEVV